MDMLMKRTGETVDYIDRLTRFAIAKSPPADTQENRELDRNFDEMYQQVQQVARLAESAALDGADGTFTEQYRAVTSSLTERMSRLMVLYRQNAPTELDAETLRRLLREADREIQTLRNSLLDVTKINAADQSNPSNALLQSHIQQLRKVWEHGKLILKHCFNFCDRG
jgi:hypothetical protein